MLSKLLMRQISPSTDRGRKACDFKVQRQTRTKLAAGTSNEQQRPPNTKEKPSEASREDIMLSAFLPREGLPKGLSRDPSPRQKMEKKNLYEVKYCCEISQP